MMVEFLTYAAAAYCVMLVLYTINEGGKWCLVSMSAGNARIAGGVFTRIRGHLETSVLGA